MSKLFRSYPRTVWLGYAYTVCSWFGITSLWVIYLAQQGLSLVEIGLCESIFHVASFLFEVPSGMLADRFQYKTNLLVSRVAAMLSTAVMLLAHNFWWFAVSFVFSAWSYNLQSGTLEALFYESLASHDQAGAYPRVTAMMNSLIEISQTGGVVIAGLLVPRHFALTYWVALILGATALVLCLFMTEPPTHHAVGTAPLRLPVIMRHAGHILNTNQRLLSLMVFSAVFSAIGTTYYYYFQNLLADQHVAGTGISALMVTVAMLNVAAVQVTPRLSARLSPRRLIRVLASTLVGCLLLSGWPMFWWLIGLYLAVNVLQAIIAPLFSTYYNTMIPSSERATLLSVDSMFFSLTMILLFPALGWLVQNGGFSAAFASIGGLLALALLVLKFRKVI